jgi:hypothetical protein
LPLYGSGSNLAGITAAQVGAVSTNGGRLSAGLFSDVDYSATSPQGDEIPTAEWVRSLAIQGAEWYFTPDITNGFGEKTTNFVALSTDTDGAFTNSIAAPASSSYLVGGITTQLYGEVRSPITFEVWAFRSGAALSLPCHPEIYYVYNGTTNHLGDWEAGNQDIAASAVPTKYTWTVSFMDPVITGGVRIVGYLKSGTVTGPGTINILGRGSYDSHMTIEGAPVGQSAGEVAAALAAHTSAVNPHVGAASTQSVSWAAAPACYQITLTNDTAISWTNTWLPTSKVSRVTLTSTGTTTFVWNWPTQQDAGMRFALDMTGMPSIVFPAGAIYLTNGIYGTTAPTLGKSNYVSVIHDCNSYQVFVITNTIGTWGTP